MISLLLRKEDACEIIGDTEVNDEKRKPHAPT